MAGAICASAKGGIARSKITPNPCGSTCPAHDVERVGPDMLAAHFDRREAGLAGAQHAGGGAVAEQGGGDDVGLGQLVEPERQGAKLDRHQQHDRCPGGLAPGARRSTSPETPPAQPRPKTGTRSTSARKPMRAATRASRLGVAMPVDETVTTVSTSAAVRPAASSALVAASINKLHAAVEIGVGALRPAERFEIPFDRAHRVAPANPGSLEDPRQTLEIAKAGGEAPVRRGRGITLLD